MARTIAVEDLHVGIFIQLDVGWLSQPFALTCFHTGQGAAA